MTLQKNLLLRKKVVAKKEKKKRYDKICKKDCISRGERVRDRRREIERSYEVGREK